MIQYQLISENKYDKIKHFSTKKIIWEIRIREIAGVEILCVSLLPREEDAYEHNTKVTP